MKSSCLYIYVFASALLLVQKDAHGWETSTHSDIAREATDISVSTADSLAGLGIASISESLTYAGTTKSAVDWIREGAVREDDTFSATLFRYKNHFYDPVSGQGFSGFLGGLALSGNPAPNWALDMGPNDGQYYSFVQARQYFYNALTKPTDAERKSELALMFRTLGNVLHMTQDMAQPQHTRNDSHALGSLYEQYTKLGNNLTYSGAVIPAVTNACRLFTDPTIGLSDFSNGSFISEGTNFQGTPGNFLPNENYAFPTPGAEETVSIQDPSLGLDSKIRTGLTNFCPDCTMDFVSSVNQKGETFQRAATYSIFASDLARYDTTQPLNAVFKPNPGLNPSLTFNRVNFDAVNSVVIPRATAYSAGLLNYFFRGKMVISLPASGVYGIADDATASGFTLLKLKLRNETPNETMTNGNVQAIIKYRPLAAGCKLLGADASCRSKPESETITLSQIEPISSLGSQDQPFTFTFDSPLPFGATDVQLQVVFKGTLGAEPNAVAVATRDISEPTFLTAINSLNYIHINGSVYLREELRTDQALLAIVFAHTPPPLRDYDLGCVIQPGGVFQLQGHCFIQTSADQLLTLNGGVTVQFTLPDPGTYSQIAYLSDKDPVSVAESGSCDTFTAQVPAFLWDEQNAPTFKTVRGLKIWNSSHCAEDGDYTPRPWNSTDFARATAIPLGVWPVRSTISGF